MRLRRSIVLCALVMVGVSVTAGTMSAHASQDTPRGNQIVGTITADILRAPDQRTESALGNTLADAQLAATQGTGAQIALVSPTSIGADLLFASSRDHEGDGVVTYREARAVQPAREQLVTLTLTGAQIYGLLEQQFTDTGVRLLLSPSATLHYTYSASAPAGSKVTNLTINGVPVDPAATYRVTVTRSLAAGAEGFTVLLSGTEAVRGSTPLEALVVFLAANSPLPPAATDRITQVP